MPEKDKTAILLILSILLLVVVIADLALGSVFIPFREFIKIIAGKSDNANWVYIVLQLRAPRVITAILAGAGLSAAGLMMQTLFRNPLAGPYVLGISSGASLGVALFIMAAGLLPFSLAGIAMYWGHALAAITGAILVFLLIVVVAGRIRDSVSLLIVGIMFGSIAGALINILQYFSTPDQIQKFVIWTMGSLSATGWKQILVLSPFVLAGTVVSVLLIKPMNALLLGENNARISGVNIERTRYLILIATCLLAGAITAFTGPLAFIGLAVPHLTRMLFKSTNHRIIVPGVLLAGALQLVICDLLSQVPGKNLVLPINAINALFGAPVVLWIIIGRKKLKTAF